MTEVGENGYIAESAEPEALAQAILRVRKEGQPLRERTASWFRRNVDQLSLERSLDVVVESYHGAPVLAAPAQAEDREEERGEEDLDADDRQCRADHRKPLFGQASEAAVHPGRDHDALRSKTGGRRILPPSSNPCSRRNRGRMRSNQLSRLPMKYVP